MLRITQTWNAVLSASYVRRGLALAQDYPQNRVGLGDAILNHPLHPETLSEIQALHRLPSNHQAHDRQAGGGRPLTLGPLNSSTPIDTSNSRPERTG